MGLIPDNALVALPRGGSVQKDRAVLTERIGTVEAEKSGVVFFADIAHVTRLLLLLRQLGFAFFFAVAYFLLTRLFVFRARCYYSHVPH